VSVSILQILATKPDGSPGQSLSLGELGAYLRAHCNRLVDQERNDRHKLRDELYRDGGVEAICKVIDEVFSDETVRSLRKAWAKYARFNNALKRIVGDLSTVYSEPARRAVNDNEPYQELLEELQIDEYAQEWNRLYNLHSVLLVGFRVRVMADGTRDRVLDLVTPATWRVVLHPNDNKVVVGHLIRTDFRSVRTDWIRTAAWVLWTDHERVHLDANLEPIVETYTEHKIGVCPFVVLKRSVAVPGFWPGEEGEDLSSGQVAITLANILLLKETKSATKLPIIQGDASDMVKNQPADTERQISVPEGVAVNVVDVSMDTSLFTSAADHIMDGLANNHGMSAAQVRHQSATSGEAQELMRVPIRELRRSQLPTFRLFERRLARVMVAVIAVDDPARVFPIDGWKIDFGEEQTPMTPTERVQLHLLRRSAGLDNPIDFYRSENPDLDDEAAALMIQRNIDICTWLVRLMRELQSLGASPNTGPASNQQNVPGARAAPPANEQQPVQGQAA
jgi:hypothetical protein